MLAIKTKLAECNTTDVIMEFQGSTYELLNAADGVLKGLAQCLVENCPDGTEYTVRRVFVERFTTHLSVAIDNKLKGGNSKAANTEKED